MTHTQEPSSKRKFSGRLIATMLLAGFSLCAGADTFVVTNTQDSGTGSLRDAIEDANLNIGQDTIEFSISGTSPWTISPSTPLPAITGPLLIDAPADLSGEFNGISPKPLVELNGNNLSIGSGLDFAVGAGGSTVSGLAIINFPEDGIEIAAADVQVVVCFLGVNSSGTSAGNGEYGIDITGQRARIGDGELDLGGRNLISANGAGGIRIGAGDEHTIANNFIGRTPTAEAPPSKNAGDGILITDSENTQIGVAGLNGNVISSHQGAGIRLRSALASNNTVLAALVGSFDGRSDPLANEDGIVIEDGANNNAIGGDIDVFQSRNAIAGNTNAGVRITGNGTDSNTVKGNALGVGIGIDSDGNDVVVSSANFDGIIIENGASQNIIGGASSADRNIISANDGAGIAIFGLSENNQILGNYIGLNLAGDGARPNATGIVLLGANGTSIGNPGPGTTNFISGNTGHGISLGMGAANTQIFGNRIGLGATNSDQIGNGTSGVYISDDSGNNRVGGLFSGEPNTISYNGGNGVTVISDLADGNVIRGNTFQGNGELAIDLGNDGVTLNDDGDGDAGPNRLQNFPAISNIDFDTSTGQITIDYSVPSATVATGTEPSTYPLNVDFYVADGSGREGERFLGEDTYTASDHNSGTDKQISFGTTLARKPDVVIGTATDAANNTSEFTAVIIHRDRFEAAPP